MLVLKDPGLRKLEKFIANNPLTHSTILHWTGSMWESVADFPLQKQLLA